LGSLPPLFRSTAGEENLPRGYGYEHFFFIASHVIWAFSQAAFVVGAFSATNAEPVSKQLHGSSPSTGIHCQDGSPQKTAP
jgi:hypothetical protein